MTIARELAAAGPGFTTETDPATGYTFLQRAVLADDEQGLKFLLELGARVVCTGIGGCRGRSGELIWRASLCVMEPCAWGTHQGQCGEAPSLDTPLHMATARGNVAFVQALVRADPTAAVSPNVTVRNRSTPKIDRFFNPGLLGWHVGSRHRDGPRCTWRPSLVAMRYVAFEP